MEPAPLTSFKKPKPTGSEPASLASLLRAIIARAACALDGNNRPLDYAAEAWPNDAAVPMILRAASAPLSMTTAAALVPVVTQFVKALAPMSAAGALLNSAGVQLTSLRTNVAVPGFAPGEADFVAELAAIPVKQFVSSGPVLSPYKLASICVVSGELIDNSDAEALVRTALTESVSLALDRVLFSTSAAVPGKQPAGLLNGIAGLTPAAGGGAKQDAMATDIAALATAISAVAGSGWMLVASPSQAISLSFRLGQQVPNVFISGALAPGTVIMIAPQAVAVAFETPRIDASIEATVHMDTAAAAIVNGGAMAAPVRSLFQTNSVGLRMITPVSWGLRAPGAVSWMSGVSW